MPILIDGGTSTTTAGRSVTIPGVPTFNADDWNWVVTDLEGWDDGLPVEPVLVPNGGGDGAIAVGGTWRAPERYITLGGSVEIDPGQFESIRSLLLGAFPRGDVAALTVSSSEAERQAFVRMYDRPTLTLLGRVLTFSLPLVAPDPFKYGPTPLTATAGGFVPQDWFRTYSDDGGGDWYRTYSPEGAAHYRDYEASGEGSELPTVASIESAGDVSSRRMTITVTGPLTAGLWWVEDANGTRLWANVSLASGQSIVFDCRTRSATLAGNNIDHLVFGDYLALDAGDNSYRLIADGAGGSYMNIEALEGYR